MKLKKFQLQLQIFRYEASYLPIHELLYLVYDRTGYYDYVSAMPAGETRRANLDMLVEKAAAYEKTSYKGLFQFIRYIHKLKKYETDFGEASTAGAYENMVQIMSIHKSKGLEFPICFVAGTGKLFNKQDVRGKLMIDSDLGIGTDYLDLEQRTKTVTLKKNGINVTGCHGVDFSYPEYIKKYMGKKAEGNVISGDEEKALFSAGIPERFDYEQKLIDKSNDGFLLFFEKEKTEAIVSI